MQRKQVFYFMLSCALMLSAFLPISAQNNTMSKATKTAASEINYTVSMSKPQTHLLEVEMRVRQNGASQNVDLIMPVWTPGSYLIREYERHVQDFAAKDASGKALTWDKLNKNTWRITSNSAGEIVVNYKVYSNELTVRTNELNSDHAFWNNAALLMYPKDNLKTPSTLKVVPFGSWKVATALEPSGTANTFRAENFDILYDSPFEVGNFVETSFNVKGIPHRLVINGAGNYDLERLRQDIPKIIEVESQIFNNELPYKKYLFILNLRSGGGGLEHLNGQSLLFNRFGFQPEARYTGFLTLVAHEFFHLWNVKRIRPDALGPFDYTAENYTKNLWIAEGITSYYENIAVKRAGFIDGEQFLSERAAEIADLQRRPGRFQTSVEEASFDAWIKFYRPDENSVNNQISYYDKGAIVGMMLDLEIRRATQGAKSLDDVMRSLFNDFFKKNKNYTPQDFQKVAENVAGKSLNEFFTKYVRGREELDYNQTFADFGIKLETTTNAPETALLGAEFRPTGDLTVAQVRAGTPAYEQGLNAGDQVIAMNGFRVASQLDLNARLAERKPNDKIKLTIFRYDELRELEIVLGGTKPQVYRFTSLAGSTENQQKLYQGWLGADSE